MLQLDLRGDEIRMGSESGSLMQSGRQKSIPPPHSLSSIKSPKDDAIDSYHSTLDNILDVMTLVFDEINLMELWPVDFVTPTVSYLRIFRFLLSNDDGWRTQDLIVIHSTERKSSSMPADSLTITQSTIALFDTRLSFPIALRLIQES